MSNNIYCTYLTVYSGNKLPPFYIGYTSIENIGNGYRGSVNSKKYKEIWKSELKNNPNLFKTKILTTHNTREEAIEKEKYFQESLDVVKSPLYVNQAIASINGCFGVQLFGRNNHRYGKVHTYDTRKLLSEKCHEAPLVMSVFDDGKKISGPSYMGTAKNRADRMAKGDVRKVATMDNCGKIIKIEDFFSQPDPAATGQTETNKAVATNK